ncbi:MAG: glycosyltransferase family 4 protein [Actinobacteria bacterium]|nr:glycosyltransferase family 4 protein [Actinomycetota bacterium]
MSATRLDQARSPLRLAIVIPRYGTTIVGGAELHARLLAQHLSAAGHAVDVLTTCAVSHYTWHNELPAGPVQDGAIVVRRFPVDERDPGVHAELEGAIVRGLPLSREEERLWLRNGVASSAMEEELEREGDRYDYVLAMPYLFGTTYFAYAANPERTLLIPCLHDEPYARLRVVADMLRGARGVLFNAQPEAELGTRLSGSVPRQAIVGLGFEPEEPADTAAFRRRHNLDGPFVLAVGRREGGKNTPLLFEYFLRYKERHPGALRLVSAGSGDVPVPKRPDMVDLRPDWSERDAMYRASTVFCQPSVNESLSIVMMQAWLAQRPVLVHTGGVVTRDHCVRSNGGLWFSNYAEFESTLDRLLADPELRAGLGSNGSAYVRTTYSWEAVLARFEAAAYEWLTEAA